jgi:hypothetical protein
MKTIIALIKGLFGPEPPPGPPAKKPYRCGWQRTRSSRPRPHDVGRLTTQTPVEMREADEQRGLPWFPEDI